MKYSIQPAIQDYVVPLFDSFTVVQKGPEGLRFDDCSAAYSLVV